MVYRRNNPPSALPAFVLAGIDIHTCPSFDEEHAMCVHIAPVEVTWSATRATPCHNAPVGSCHLPPVGLQSCHESLGQMIDKVVVNLRPSENSRAELCLHDWSEEDRGFRGASLSVREDRGIEQFHSG
ncbi:unnamed protein product [Discosporangium mesarthrocarpum]